MNDQSIHRFLAHAADAVGQHDPAEALRLAKLACIRLEIELGLPSSFSAAAQARCGHPECVPVERPYDPAERGSWSPCVCWLDPDGCTAHASSEAASALSTLLCEHPAHRKGGDDSNQYEAESTTQPGTRGKRTYVILRCRTCDRISGERLVRRTAVQP